VSGEVAAQDSVPVGPAPRVTGVETYALRVPLSRPIADATWQSPAWIVPVVEITTEDGFVGTGCSGVHTGHDLICTAISTYFAPLLVGQPCGEIRGIWERLARSPIRWVARAGVVHMGQGMVDTALWDIAAQRAGLPLWQYLGGHHPELHSYNTDGGWLNWTIDELITDMAAMVDAGWNRVKMKVGKPDWREDVARVRAVRAALGDDITLMCDVNHGWDLMQATRMLPYLEEVGMGWIEEPFHPDDVESHRRLQAMTRVPVAIGESLYSLHAFNNFIGADAVRVVQCDVSRVGGVTEWLQIAAAAASAGLWVVPHAGDMMQVHQHLVAATFADKPAMIEYIPWTLDVYDYPCEVERGMIKLPTVPGASTRVRADAREKWQIPDVGGRLDA
jgi:L-alanine-DL-glutamate epimerase-like enolase superfamily enzyme